MSDIRALVREELATPVDPRAAAMAALAPRRRTASWPSAQQLACSGKGWPPQRLSCWRALVSDNSNISVHSAGAKGSTFRLTSAITPSVPMEPAIKRLTS